MAKLAEPSIGFRNIGNVPNRKVANLHFLVVVVVVVLVLDKKFALA